MRRLKIAVGVVISAALLAYVLRNLDVHQLRAELAGMHWGWALVSAALAPAGLWVRAQRWRFLFPPRANPPALVPAVMIGYMVNNILPLRAGEVVRVYVVARHWPGRFWTTLATLVVERLFDSLVIVLILALLVLRLPVPALVRGAAATLLAIDVAGVLVLALMAAAPERCRRLVSALVRCWPVRRWPALERHATAMLGTFMAGLDGVRARSHALPLIAWTVAVWLAPALAAWTMLRAMHLDLPILAGWTVMTFVGLGVSIPSAPGYVGVFHTAAALALGMFAVPEAQAASYALVFHVSQYLPVTLVGWLYLLREQTSLADLTRPRPVPDGSPDGVAVAAGEVGAREARAPSGSE